MVWLSCLINTLIKNGDNIKKMIFDHWSCLVEDKLFLNLKQYSGYKKKKSFKKSLKEDQSEKNNLFDEANSCITLISTANEKSQHRHLAVFALVLQVEKFILCQ